MTTKIDKYAYAEYSSDEKLYYLSYRDLGFWKLSEQSWHTEREAIEAYRAGIVRFGLVTKEGHENRKPI